MIDLAMAFLSAEEVRWILKSQNNLLLVGADLQISMKVCELSLVYSYDG